MGISTHILDITRGKPAANVEVVLDHEIAGAWTRVGQGKTNEDGRVKPLLDDKMLKTGNYRITFMVKPYLDQHHHGGFYPEISIAFVVANASEHFHVPLLLTPYGFSTYRGS